MSHSPILFIALIIIVAVITGIAKVLDVNFSEMFGGSFGTIHLREMGIDEEEKKDYEIDK